MLDFAGIEHVEDLQGEYSIQDSDNGTVNYLLCVQSIIRTNSHLLEMCMLS